MSELSSRISDEWIEALSESLGVFGALMLDHRVVESWPEASILDGYTVGGIAGHVLSLMAGLLERLDSPSEEGGALPYVNWYGPALSSGVLSSAQIEMAEELATGGPAVVAAGLAAAGNGLVGRLDEVEVDFLVPLASVAGAGVRLDDFIRTRFVEIIVHAHDIASSAGLPSPNFPVQACALAVSAITECTGAGVDDPRTPTDIISTVRGST